MGPEGGSAKRFFLLGTDYVYPRTTNKILRAFLHSKGVKDADIQEIYTPFGHSDYQTIVANIKTFSQGGKTTVVSTINGDSNVLFYKELGNQGLKATDVSAVAFSVGEEELRDIDTKPLVGHLTAWNYFMSVKNPNNSKFEKEFFEYVKAQNLPDGDKCVTNDPMEGSDLRRYPYMEVGGQESKEHGHGQGTRRNDRPDFRCAFGFHLMDGNHHLYKPVMIGEIRGDGPVQRRVEDQDCVACAAMEPVYRGQSGQAGCRVVDSVVPAPPARGPRNAGSMQQGRACRISRNARGCSKSYRKGHHDRFLQARSARAFHWCAEHAQQLGVRALCPT